MTTGTQTTGWRAWGQNPGQQFGSLMANPLFGFGVGMLAGNRGRSGGAAFQNALLSGMQMGQQGQLLGADISRQQAQMEMMKQQQIAAQQQVQAQAMALDQQRRLEAAAPQLMAGMTSADPATRQQAAMGLATFAPEVLPTMASNLLTQQPQEPTSRMRFIEEFMALPQEQQAAAKEMGLVGAPQTVISMGAKLPTNYQWIDPQDPAKGVEPIKGSPAEKGTRQQEHKLGAVRSALDRYKTSLHKHGAEVMPGPAKAELQTAYIDLLMEMKELFNLGVLQGQDYEIMTRTLTDPTTFQGKTMELTSGLKGFDAQLELIERKLNEARERAKLLSGRQPSGGMTEGQPPLPPGFVRE